MMKKEIKKYNLDENRVCPICGESKSTHICDIGGTVRKLGHI